MERLSVLKIGGNILDDVQQRRDLLRDFAALPGRKILVHGGGKVATRIGTQLGITPKYVDGRRITDAETLGLVTMVYGGSINKGLVAELQAAGCNAIGLTGADGGVISAVKRPVVTTDFGFVGDLQEGSVNTATLDALLRAALTPVFAPLTYDGAGGLLNTNADTIAQALAVAMTAHYRVQLVYCFEKAGVLRDPEDDASLIRQIDRAAFAQLKESGVISGGMIPKVENALAAVAAGVEAVIIGRAAPLADLINGTGGTRIS